MLAALLPVGLQAAETLHIYTWADYVNPDLVEKFEEENDCKVVIDTFDSNEAMYARLKAGAKGYDIIFPSSYIVPLMEKDGMLATLDHTKLPNLKNIDPEVLSKVYDKEMKLSVPYTMSYTVIAYSKSKLKDPEASWKLFKNPELKKRMTLLDDPRETLGIGLKMLGYSINTRDEKQLAEAAALVKKIKPNLAKFDNEGYKAGLDSGEFLLVHGYSGDLWQVAQENEDIGILLPKEGFTGACDEMVVPKTAPQPELAHKFINFLLDGKVSGENMEWLGYVCPNVEGMKNVSAEFLENPVISIPDELKSKIEIIEDMGDDLPKYTKAWDDLKGGD